MRWYHGWMLQEKRLMMVRTEDGDAETDKRRWCDQVVRWF